MPTDPKARTLAMGAWAVAALLGTIAVWWLSSYLDTLTTLARTDRQASIALFRARVLPAFTIVVLVAVAAGALLMRQGLQVLRGSEVSPSEMVREINRRHGTAARALGWLLAAAGLLLAVVPLAILAITFWMLRRV